MSDSQIKELKAQAKTIKSELGIKHQQALDEAARRSGFNDYHHARKELLKKPHVVIFGLHLKYVLDCSSDFLAENGLSEHPTYWDQCRQAYEDYFYSDSQDEDDPLSPDEWIEHNDWVALTFERSEIKSIKDAIDYIRELFFHPPEFIVFDDMLVDLSEYASDDYVRFSG
ncbi:hypothetical protein DV711_15290 [Motiliproteus coralliicola]|uniref:Uncharacterized protein n=1 Tax=Motiliproteus coralliicola TaxID=2283196 RepID=A0A369WCB4_9GAMM|nr:hypothetical protein [Motiliproteus coralliicola]RDE18971.1 hypothetical protein DV711_15290 [Motiliproteus coralliicola]